MAVSQNPGLQAPVSHYPAPLVSHAVQFAAQAEQVLVDVKPKPSLHIPESHFPDPFVTHYPASQFVSHVTQTPFIVAYSSKHFVQVKAKPFKEHVLQFGYAPVVVPPKIEVFT